MVTISVKLRGLKETLEDLERKPAQLDRAVRAATDDATDAMAEHAERIIVSRAGGLYWDIETGSYPIPGGARGTVATGPNSPHIIVPNKPNGVLAFEGSDGEMVFTRRVNHPGSNPPDWLSDIDARTVNDIGARYERGVAEVFGAGLPSTMPRAA